MRQYPHYSGSGYEREFRSILQGDEETLHKVTRSCDIFEKDRYRLILKRPFMVVRAAGSLGVDLVAIRSDISFPVEIKSSIKEVIRFGGSRLEEQAEELLSNCQRCGVVPIYAFRKKNVRGDSWRIYTMEFEGEGLAARQGIVHNHIPKLKLTQSGNFVMDWETGLPLNKFIEYLHGVATW